ncbi:MAG TPA: beta-ketoacyl-[acyl-carrier-protein] synthase family protein [Acidobacteriaceae bacterium]|nr:beta-ketoacyl-[acyl-carrier-protein] synthase family protein [Acidobacteriaceae bacterium]
MKRVVVTGLGCITPIGNTVAEFREALYAGRTGIAEFDPNFPGAIAGSGLRFKTSGQVKNFDPVRNEAQRLASGVIVASDSSAQFGIVAARHAATESGLVRHYDPATMAIVTGCSCGGRAADEDANRHLYTRNARIHPTAILRAMASSGVSSIAIELGVTGPVLNISTACAAGTHAIGMAFQMVRSGMASAAIAGGYEAPLTFGFLRAWDSMRVVSPTSCRPFSADRDGMTLGEGAAMLALEPLDSALARGARIYAEIVGFGMSADAHHITQPSAEGASLAITRAVQDAANAGLNDVVSRIGYINAHGTGTPTNDAVEAAAIHQALGECGARVPVGSTKSLTGHSIGAAGAIEALATILALDEESLPHTAGVTEADPTLDLDIILGEPREIEAGRDIALSNSLAFGGLNAVLAFRRFAE